jgi:lipopolysaccharide assembly outer membrane protein LptD (OstA)
MHSDPRLDPEIAQASESSEPLTLTADEIDVDRIALTYVAKGHVRFVQGSRSAHADLAMLDEQKHTLDLIGDANVYDGDRRAAAAKMHYDMLDKDFLGAGDVRLYQPLPTPGPQASGTPAPKRKRRLPL